MNGKAGAGEGRLDANMFIEVYNWLSLETVTKLLIIHYRPNINNCFLILGLVKLLMIKGLT